MFVAINFEDPGKMCKYFKLTKTLNRETNNENQLQNHRRIAKKISS